MVSDTEPIPDPDREPASPQSDQPPTENGGQKNDEDKVDEMSEESFPTSDPPSTWGGEDNA